LVHGKSTTCEILKDKYNALVISADEVYKELITLPHAIDLIANRFDESILENKKINLTALSNIVFNDKNKLDILNSITHPLIMEEIKKEILASSSNYIILDVPLPIQEFIDICDVIITVISPISTRIERIMNRSKLSYDEALARINNQLSDEEYKKIADFVICNDNNLEQLKEKINELIL